MDKKLVEMGLTGVVLSGWCGWNPASYYESDPKINTQIRFISDKIVLFESLPRALLLMICPSVSSSLRWLLCHRRIYALWSDQSVPV